MPVGATSGFANIVPPKRRGARIVMPIKKRNNYKKQRRRQANQNGSLGFEETVQFTVAKQQ